MISRQITSAQHPIVKRFVKLRQERAFREEEQSVVVVGYKLISELARHTPLKTVLVDREFPLVSTVLATPEILKKVTGLQTPEGIAAEVALPPPSDLKNAKRLLVLDGLSDPGNVGTLLRTALALGWDGVFLTSGSADIFNDKALRAAKGASFYLPYRIGTWEELVSLLQGKSVFIADTSGNPLVPSTPCALILGNESHGPSSLAKKMGVKVSIPMKKGVESLNVASAGAILMYELNP